MSITTHLLEYLIFYRTHHFIFYIPSLNNFLCDNNWLQNVSFTFEMAQTGSWQWEMVENGKKLLETVQNETNKFEMGENGQK